MAPAVEPVTAPVLLGESPHWDHEEQVLYFISILEHTIHKYVPETGLHTMSKLGGMPSFVIPIEGKRDHFVVGLNRSVLEVVWDGTENSAKVVRTVAEVDQDNLKNRFNDAKADPMGRLFAGTLSRRDGADDTHSNGGSLYRIDPDGTVHKLESNLVISNGMCWDLNRKAFYYADSSEHAVRRYDYDVEKGNIANPKLVFLYKDYGLKGIVDGMTIDVDGNLWIANFDGHQLLNVDPHTSELIRKVPIPALQVTSVTFGGSDLDVLYVTSAALNIKEEQKPPCGATFKVTGLGVKGHQSNKARFD